MPLCSVNYFLFQLSSHFHSIFSTHLLLYFKVISKKLNYWLIRNISKYFLHSNLPYVLFIWQSRIICTKNSFMFNAIFWKIFMEYIKIFFTGSIELLLLFKKSQLPKNLVKYWQGYLRLNIPMWGWKKMKKQ